MASFQLIIPKDNPNTKWQLQADEKYVWYVSHGRYGGGYYELVGKKIDEKHFLNQRQFFNQDVNDLFKNGVPEFKKEPLPLDDALRQLLPHLLTPEYHEGDLEEKVEIIVSNPMNTGPHQGEVVKIDDIKRIVQQRGRIQICAKYVGKDRDYTFNFGGIEAESLIRLEEEEFFKNRCKFAQEYATREGKSCGVDFRGESHWFHPQKKYIRNQSSRIWHRVKSHIVDPNAAQLGHHSRYIKHLVVTECGKNLVQSNCLYSDDEGRGNCPACEGQLPEKKKKTRKK